MQAVARHSKDYSGLKVDWQTQTLLTAGATEALAATFLALVNPGDEVSIQNNPHIHQLICPLSFPFSNCSLRNWGSKEMVSSPFLASWSQGVLPFILVKLRTNHTQVIILDPMYDAYSVMAERAGAVVIPVKLDEDNWSIPTDALDAAFSERTKLILVNTPHNPTGKVRIWVQHTSAWKPAH